VSSEPPEKPDCEIGINRRPSAFVELIAPPNEYRALAQIVDQIVLIGRKNFRQVRNAMPSEPKAIAVIPANCGCQYVAAYHLAKVRFVRTGEVAGFSVKPNGVS
jgi:hypothetical protein